MELEDLLRILFLIVSFVGPWLYKLLTGNTDDSDAEEKRGPLPVPRREPVEAPAPRPASAPAPRPVAITAPAAASRSGSPAPAWMRHRERLIELLEKLRTDALERGAEARFERANERFTEVLTGWLPTQAGALSSALTAREQPVTRAQAAQAEALEMILAEVEVLMAQRRDPELLPLLGDADALAEACYAPVVAFARAEGLPLATARPVTELTDFDLSIWTGFAPTSLAPLFLPRDFFHRAFWWPALAHEIGHDFLVSVHGLPERLREELNLVSAELGSQPLRLYDGGIPASELHRMWGNWLDEAFCDVFGTLMCGQAYLASMVELFAAPESQLEVLAVGVDEQQGVYAPHPPRHLRVKLCAALLERLGMAAEARVHLERWNALHGFDAEDELPIVFPTHQGALRLPATPVLEPGLAIMERLYAGPLTSLNGFGLQDISGLDHGPRASAEAVRAKVSLLAGRPPGTRDPRAVVGGLVLATLERPELEPQLIARARAAIPAIGTRERHANAYEGAAHAAHTSVPGILDTSAAAITEALLLEEILTRRSSPSRCAPRLRRTG